MGDKLLKIKEPYEGSFILLAIATMLPKKSASLTPYHLTGANRDLSSEEYRDPMNEIAHINED
jgi:hypothetical protein